MIVMKFGGTSVKDRAAIERLIEIVRHTPQPVVVRVNASTQTIIPELLP